MLDKLKANTSTVAKKALQGANKVSSNVLKKSKKNTDKYLVSLDIGTEYIKALIGKVS